VVRGRCLRTGESVNEVNEVNADDSAPEAVPGRRGGRQRAPGQGHAPAVAGTVEATHVALCPTDVATLEAGYNVEFLNKYLILCFVYDILKIIFTLCLFRKAKIVHLSIFTEIFEHLIQPSLF